MFELKKEESPVFSCTGYEHFIFSSCRCKRCRSCEKVEVSSTAFGAGKVIPKQYTGDGKRCFATFEVDSRTKRNTMLCDFSRRSGCPWRHLVALDYRQHPRKCNSIERRRQQGKGRYSRIGRRKK